MVIRREPIAKNGCILNNTWVCVVICFNHFLFLDLGFDEITEISIVNGTKTMTLGLPVMYNFVLVFRVALVGLFDVCVL